MTESISPFRQPPSDYKAFTDGVAELMNPPKPPDGPVTVFGDPQGMDVQVPPLSEQNVPTLYDENAPPLFELKKINHRILFSFQKLVGIIANGTESPDECLEHIKHLFVNAHHLLHKLRDVQGYENMHHCLRQKNKKLEEFKAEFDKHLEETANLRHFLNEIN